MADFNKRIFGSDIDQKIKRKLLARQALAESPMSSPNESKQFIQIDDEQVDIGEAIGTHNFEKEGKH